MTVTDSPVTDDLGWGIDRIALSFAYVPELSDPTSSLWQFMNSQNLSDAEQPNDSLSGSVRVGWADINVRLYTMRNRCRIEFNPSRVITPKGMYLLPPDAVSPLVENVIDRIRDTVWPAFDLITEDGEVVRMETWRGAVTVKRLDLARNFTVDESQIVKRALEQKRSKYQKTREVFESSTGGWGIENRTRQSGKDMFYDKKSELAATGHADKEMIGVTDGVFRFEAQMRGSRLTSKGLATLDAISYESCWDALVTRWEATGWGSPISTGGDFYCLAAQLPYPERAKLVGYLMLKAHGAADGISPSAERKMRKRAEQLGLTVGLPLETQGEPDAYLDLEAGALSAWSANRTNPWVQALSFLEGEEELDIESVELATSSVS